MVEAQVGEDVRRLRGAKRMVQEQLASKAGLSSKAVANLENGRNSPRLSTLEQIAEALGMIVVVTFTDKPRRLRPAA